MPTDENMTEPTVVGSLDGVGGVVGCQGKVGHRQGGTSCCAPGATPSWQLLPAIFPVSSRKVFEFNLEIFGLELFLFVVNKLKSEYYNATIT